MNPLTPTPVQAERVLDLLKREFTDTPSYIDPMILTKGGTLLLGGEAKVGKSFLMLELCRALTTGTKFLDHPDMYVPRPIRCLYIDPEVGERTNKERILKIFHNENSLIWGDNLWHVSKNLNLQLDNPRGLQYFADLVKDVQPNVLLLDSINFMWHRDENSAMEVGNLFVNLARLKERGQAQEMSIVLAHHFKKPPFGEYAKEYDYLDEYNFRGSGKWKDGGDTLITMHRYSEVPRNKGDEAWKLKLRFLCRHGPSMPEGKFAFNLDGDLRIKYRGEDTVKKGVGLPKLKLVYIPQEPLTQDELFTPAQKEYTNE